MPERVYAAHLCEEVLNQFEFLHTKIFIPHEIYISCVCAVRILAYIHLIAVNVFAGCFGYKLGWIRAVAMRRRRRFCYLWLKRFKRYIYIYKI